MDKLIKKYVNAVNTAEDTAWLIAEKIYETVKDVIPNIQYSLGGMGRGIERIIFFLEPHRNWDVNLKRFERIVYEVFPELYPHIDSTFYVSLEEAEEIIKRLKELKERDNEG